MLTATDPLFVFFSIEQVNFPSPSHVTILTATDRLFVFLSTEQVNFPSPSHVTILTATDPLFVFLSTEQVNFPSPSHLYATGPITTHPLFFSNSLNKSFFHSPIS